MTAPRSWELGNADSGCDQAAGQRWMADGRPVAIRGASAARQGGGGIKTWRKPQGGRPATTRSVPTPGHQSWVLLSLCRRCSDLVVLARGSPCAWSAGPSTYQAPVLCGVCGSHWAEGSEWTPALLSFPWAKRRSSSDQSLSVRTSQQGGHQARGLPSQELAFCWQTERQRPAWFYLFLSPREAPGRPGHRSVRAGMLMGVTRHS